MRLVYATAVLTVAVSLFGFFFLLTRMQTHPVRVSLDDKPSFSD